MQSLGLSLPGNILSLDCSDAAPLSDTLHFRVCDYFRFQSERATLFLNSQKFISSAVDNLKGT